MRGIRRVIPLLLLIALTLTGSFAQAADGPKDVVQEYIANLIHNDWDAAKTFWHPDDLRRSQRLGIHYLGTPLKIDCASPLIPLLDRIGTGDVVFGYGEVETRDSIAVVPLRIHGQGEAALQRYYASQTGTGWALVSPLTALTRTWNHTDTRYARVFYSDSTLVNQSALDVLDAFVESTASQLQIYDDELRHLQDLKLHYYLCNEAQIEQITGYAVHGMTSLPMDAIVTRHLPHYHELVHALINYRLRRVNLHTLPIVQEGLAVALGGRWEKSADVLRQFGSFMLESGFVDLDSILTNDGFQTSVGSLDASYAAGGLLSRYLIDTYGMTKYLALYEHMGSPDTKVNEWTCADVQNTIARVYQVPWRSIADGVRVYAAANSHGRLRPGGALPADVPSLSMSEENATVRIWDTEDSYVFSVTTGSDHPELIIALRDTDSDVTGGYASRLFAKHAPETPYNLEHYGLVVSNAEAGLYDYYTDNLLEKYVLSFDPSGDYWDASAKEIRFRVKKDALPRPLDSYVAAIYIP